MRQLPHRPWRPHERDRAGERQTALVAPRPPLNHTRQNITPDLGTGIGAWTNAQLVTAIREGKRPDGSAIGPPMAIEFYKYMSDRDAKAIVAYLRSVKPVKHKGAKTCVPYSAACRKTGWPGCRHPSLRQNRLWRISGTNRPLHGMPHTHGKGASRPKKQDGRRWPEIRRPLGRSYLRQYHPGQCDWHWQLHQRQIKRGITKGVRHDGAKMRPPICYRCYDKMTEADVDTVVSYLRTIKPIKNNLR